MSAKTDSLAQVPIFQNLNKKALERLEKDVRERTFKAGDTILAEGDEGVGVFIIESGKVEVTRAGTHLNTLGPGDNFGEMALLDNYRRSATCTAVEETKTLAIMRADFLAEVRLNPDLAIDLLTILSRRIRQLDEQLAH